MDRLPQRISLVAQTCVILRERLADGEWQGLLPGELELCRRLQVSRVTLRGALQRLESEGLLTAGKGRRRRIAAPVPGPPDPAGMPGKVVILSPVAHAGLTAAKLLWIDALRGQLAAQGLPLEFLVSAAVSGARPARVLEDLTRRHPGASWVLLRSTPQVQRWFAARRLPVVVAGSLFASIRLPFVDIDYFATCRHAAGRLLARGCQRLGLVIPQQQLAGDQESEAGFREGAGAHPVSAARHDGTPDGLCRSLDALMSEPAAPHGLLVCHSTHAVTVLTRLLQRGWEIPRQVRLISRDDDPFLDHIMPPLSRYLLPPEALARHIERRLRHRFDGAAPDLKPGLLLPRFVEGATV